MKNSLRFSFLFLIFALACNQSGCGWMKDKTYTPREAEAKLVTFCQKEGNIAITTRMVNQTQWIYLAITDPLFGVKPSSDPGAKPERKTTPYALLSLDSAFNEDRKFSYTYDIVPDVLPADAGTYGMNYNEAYTKKKQIIYQGLQEIFFNVKEVDAPQFFVVMIADITQGVATKNTFFLRDLKEFMTGAIYEEYYLRELNEVIGDKNLIGDRNGRTLSYKPVTWTEFLTEQIKNRIRFKFTQSDFKPQTAPDREIVTIVANALRLYPFQDFTGLYLYNRREKKEQIFTKEQLKAFEE
ncbi:MAG: hypothetical protein HQL21_09145, partial [Candidatus Omnitrophica bacterium]|nr:hypothetical protein [Candidatus Omnitrophota bacterium]